MTAEQRAELRAHAVAAAAEAPEVSAETRDRVAAVFASVRDEPAEKGAA